MGMGSAIRTHLITQPQKPQETRLIVKLQAAELRLADFRLWSRSALR